MHLRFTPHSSEPPRCRARQCLSGRFPIRVSRFALLALAFLASPLHALHAEGNPGTKAPTEGRTKGLLLAEHPLQAFLERPIRLLPTGQDEDSLADSVTTAIRFSDVSALLDPPLPPGLYLGGTWIDLDDDGDLDLTVPIDAGNSGFLRVYRNEGTRFEEVSAQLGLEGIELAHSAAWLDIDSDGDLDLFITRRTNARTNLLFENRNGRMYRVTVDSGLEDPATEVAQAWSDFDGDGDLDVFLAGTIVAPSRLMRNDGGFRFADVTESVGLDPAFPVIAAAWADFNQDGWPDLALGAGFDFRLYRNRHGAGFVDETNNIFSPFAFLVIPSWADVDNDGDLDLLVGGFFPPAIYENLCCGGFVLGDIFALRTIEWGSGFAAGAGGTWADVDLDGDLDLLDEGGNNAFQMFENRIDEGEGLVDVSIPAGLSPIGGISWHPVTGDFDGDGRVDLFEPHQSSPRLYRNVSETSGRALRLRLVPSAGGVAVGARVSLRMNGKLQMREIAWPAAAFSFGSSDVVMALGKRGAAPAVEVRWASGRREIFRGLPSRKLNVLVEGEGRLVTESGGIAGTLQSRPDSPLSSIQPSCNPCRDRVRFSLEAAAPIPGRLEVIDMRGRVVRRLPLQGNVAGWDLRDRSGRLVPVGIYWIRSTEPGSRVPSTRIVVLR